MIRHLCASSTLLILATTNTTQAQHHNGLNSRAASDKLTPPAGAITSTMKSLDQVEPRIDANKLSGDSNWLLVIEEPGSYYLTANVIGEPGKGGIDIRSSAVTLDLNGFTVDGNGIEQLKSGINASNQVVIKNGTVINWTGAGISTRSNCTITNIHALNCRRIETDLGAAIEARSYSAIRNCRVEDSGASGIRIELSSLVADCIAINCKQNGIEDATLHVLGANSTGCIIENCIAVGNFSAGIEAAFGSLISRCITLQNRSNGFTLGQRTVTKDCISLFDQVGFFLDGYSIAENCISTHSEQSGFRCSSGASLSECVAINSRDFGFEEFREELEQSSPNQYYKCKTHKTDTGFFVIHNGSEILECTMNETDLGILVNNSASRVTIDSCTITGFSEGVILHSDSSVLRNNILNLSLSNQGHALTVTGKNNLIINNLIKGGPQSVDIAPGNKDAAIVKHPDDAGPYSNLAF